MRPISLRTSYHDQAILDLIPSGWKLGVAIGLVAVVISTRLPAAESGDAGIEFFEKHVRPILVERCYECHSRQAGEANGELLMDSRPGMEKGGTRGKLVDRDAPDKSLLIHAVQYQDAELQMPPSGKMPEAQVAILKQWVEMGAPDPRTESPAMESKFDAMPVKLQKAADHWAYQVLDSPADDRTVDELVASKLSEAGLSLSPPADRRTLIRRLYYDLLGLPPTFTEYERRLESKDERWYEKLVDELLSSPHFGERMARRWMDVARYADNKGYVFKESREYPYAYRYRDWLIRSFNEDLSFQAFVRYQLVADRLDPENKAGHLDAMGFLTLGRRFLNNKFDVIDDRIDVVSRGFLGITASCARCHDHKFDPVSTVDYYSLFGVFDNSLEPGDEPSPMRMTDREKPVGTFVFLRGNSGNRGPKVEPKFFEFLEPNNPRELKTGSGRLELAEAIVDAENPLTARVYVNRVWGWLMGKSFIDTPSDFGLRVEPPRHRELLDRLAAEFMREGWSTKQLVRRIVNSNVYRQSSAASEKGLQIDPENRLFGRAERKRMDFESYRDAVLRVTGTLQENIGGKSEPIHAPPFSKRRSLYAYIDRQNLPQLFRSFDFASPDSHVPQRSQTTVPQQGLVMLNSDMMLDLVDGLFAKATPRTSPKKEEARKLFSRLMGRPPTPIELNRLVEFVDQADESSTLIDVPENHWTYGYGTIDPESGRVESFQPFPRFDGKQWGGTGGFPDKELGWAMLNQDGGHPGLTPNFIPIRRWTAFQNGAIRLRGQVSHASKEGDGIRASLVHNRDKRLQTWTAFDKKTDTNIDKLEVKAGDTLDFVVDGLENINHDGFVWKVTMRDVVSNELYDSKLHFSGSQPTTRDAWRQLAQALLMTNEFSFVD